MRLQQALPTFYFQSPEGLGAKAVLVPVKVVKDARVVERLEASRSGLGKPAEVPAAIPLQRTQLAPALYCLKLLHPLDPGEYVLGDLSDENFNLALWPFGLFEIPSKKETKKPPAAPSDQQ